MRRDDFFAGWSGRLPRTHRAPVALFVLCFLAAALAFPLAFAHTANDPGDGGFDWAAGEQARTGTLLLEPYPMLWTPPDAAHPDGHTIVLSGEGKMRPDVSPFANGSVVEAKGFMIHRGAAETLQVSELHSADGAAKMPPTAALGRWRVGGEICDGKCSLGAMRPGTGVAHRPCANLCLIGGLPPVLFGSAPLDGSGILLLASPQGGALPERVHESVGLPVVLEGTVERRGDLLILRTVLP